MYKAGNYLDFWINLSQSKSETSSAGIGHAAVLFRKLEPELDD
jgi:hypothetical protein